MAAAFVLTSDWTARQTWAVILTGLVIIWYTWETMQLRYAAHAQRETQLRPYVVLEAAPGALSVANVGNGVALHVRLAPVIVSRELSVEIRFPQSIAILRPGQSVPLVARSYKKGVDAGDFFNAHLDPQYATLELEVKVTFDNVELKAYSTTQRVTPGNLVVGAIA
jgi:hypothetical protein